VSEQSERTRQQANARDARIVRRSERARQRVSERM
jgi:hypothetical protein